MTGTEVLIWALICTLVLFVIFAEPNQVPQDERWVMTIFGKYSRTLNPGLQFTIRGIENIATTRQDQSAKEEVVVKKGEEEEKERVEIVQEFVDEKYKSTPKGIRSTRTYIRGMIIRNTITSDGITIPEIHVQLSNRLMDESEDEAATYKNTYALGSPIREALKVLVGGVVRSVIGGHPFEEDILKKSDMIKGEIDAGIKEGMRPWGEHLNWLLMEEVIPPLDVQLVLRKPFEAKKAGEALVVAATKAAEAAVQEKNAKITAAEGEKRKIILDAEAQKQKEILETQSKSGPLQKVAKVFGWRRGGDPIQNFKASIAAADYMTIDDRTRAAVELGKGDGTVIFHDGQNGLLEGAVGVMGKVFRRIEANEEPPTKPS